MYNLIKLNKKDNVAVAPMNIPNNTKVMGYPAKNLREFLKENK